MASDALMKSQLAGALQALVTTYTAAEVSLFTNQVSPTDTSILEDFVVASDPWAAAQAVTYGQVYEEDDGSISATCPSKQFNFSGTLSATSIYGWLVQQDDVLLHARALDEVVTLDNTLSSLIVDPSIRIASVVSSD